MSSKNSQGSKMIYLALEDYFQVIFNHIRQLVYDDKTKPNYEQETSGLNQLETILEFVKNDDFYPTISRKAAYLLVSISTGHKFSNGNKRLALFTYLYFLHRNGIKYRSLRLKSYRKWFRHYFPKYTMSRHDFYTNIGWAVYNFNKCINVKESEIKHGHSYSFDEIKDIAEEFTDYILRK